MFLPRHAPATAGRQTEHDILGHSRVPIQLLAVDAATRAGSRRGRGGAEFRLHLVSLTDLPIMNKPFKLTITFRNLRNSCRFNVPIHRLRDAPGHRFASGWRRIVLRPAFIPMLVMSLGGAMMKLRAENTAMPDFALPKWESNEHVGLTNFAGEIVVLDFFAYWCAPCRRASVELEQGIQKYYADKKGNPAGLPVRVVSINIERDNPKLTEKYIRETGAELVLNDFDAALLEKLGGIGTPFIAIMDGSRATKDKVEFRLLYRSTGFEGTKKIREIIDAIKPPAPPKNVSGDAAGAIQRATGPPVTHKTEVAFETMLATDIQLTTTTIGYGQTRNDTEWSVTYTHNTLGADYDPFQLFDFLGFSERIEEDYDGGQLAIRQRLGDELVLSAAAEGYVGYTDFRSLWLANYYKQQFAFVPGYEAPDPKGYNFSTGLRWEYQPTTGFAEATFSYAENEIAPGYEFDSALDEAVHGNRILQTLAPALKFENILTPRVRTLNEFQLTFTTDRDPRFSYRGSINVALGERWVWRTTGGYTREAPTLRAWFAGTTLEVEIAPHWFVNASGHYYRDTGEIENSLLISTAAPGLQTWQAGLGLRYAGGHSSLSVSVAPVFADYQPVETGTRPFTNLYRDRTWISAQAAWSLAF